MYILRYILFSLVLLYSRSNSEVNPISQSEIITKIRDRLDALTIDVLSDKEFQSTTWHSYRFNSGAFNREELQINKIWLDEKFVLGENVSRWEKINIKNDIYVVGLTTYGFQVIKFNSYGDPVNYKNLVIERNATCMEITKTWDISSKQYIPVVIISTVVPNSVTELIWYRINEHLAVEQFWSWPFIKHVYHLETFEINNKKFLLTVNAQNESQVTSIDIYEFNYDMSEFWRHQYLMLTTRPRKIFITDVNENTFLTIVQSSNNTLFVYKFVEYVFILEESIYIDQLNYAINFEMGSNHYLAVLGINLFIYRFDRNSITRQPVHDYNFEKIEYILPMSTRTFRGDIVLLIQHSISHGTHNNSVVDAIVFHDGEFVVHDEVPCEYYSTYQDGLNCMIEEDTNIGLEEGVGLTFRNTKPAVLLKRRNMNSQLYFVDFDMIQIPNPVHVQINKVLETKKAVEEVLKQQQTILNSLSTMHGMDPPQEIIFGGNVFTNEATRQEDHKSTFDTIDTARIKSEQASRNAELVNKKIKDIRNELNSMKESFEEMMKSRQQRRINDRVTFDYLPNITGNYIIKNINVDTINGVPAAFILKNLVRKDNITKVTGPKYFSNINVENLNVQQINGVNESLIAYNLGEPIIIEGNITFVKPVTVQNNVEISGKLNNITTDDIFQANKYFNGTLEFSTLNVSGNTHADFLNGEQVPDNVEFHLKHPEFRTDENDLICDELRVSGNVITQLLNGKNLTDILNRVYFTNKNAVFSDDVFVEGDIVAKVSPIINAINNIDFPEGYVFSNNTESIRITGNKYFSGNLTVDVATVTGLVSGVDLDSVVTLSSNQHLSGKYIFEDLEVTENLTVDGSVQIEGREALPQNLILSESNTVNADVQFSHLEVDGPVFVSGLINGSTWEEYIGDIVYKDEPVVEINSKKVFSNKVSMEKSLKVLSNTINNINISTLVRSDTDSDINATVLFGDVTFTNLIIDGLFDGINITEFDETSVKLNTNQNTTTSLIFSDEEGTVPILIGEEIHIMDTFNGIDVDDYLLATEDGGFQFTGNVTMDCLVADNLTVLQNIDTPGDMFNFKEFDELRMSISRPQTIDADFVIENATIDDLTVEFINGYSISDINEMMKNFNITDMILNQRVNITALRVNGDVIVENLNGYNLTEIAENAYWLDDVSDWGDMEFLDDVTFENLDVNNWNGNNMDDFLNDIVLRTDDSIQIWGTKTYHAGLHSLGNVTCDIINDFPVSDIMTKFGEQIISSPITINGNVIIENDLNIDGQLNKMEMSFLKEVLHKNEDGVWVLKGNVVFSGIHKIDNLIVKQYINDVYVESFLENVIYKNSSRMVKGNMTFLNKVYFEEDLAIQNDYNGLNYPKFVNDIVLINKDDNINAPVVFMDDVALFGDLYVKGSLDTNLLNGWPMEEWNTNVVRLDENLLVTGTKYFDDVIIYDNIEVDYLNDVDMNTLIPLREEQYIDGNLSFIQMRTYQDNIPVSGTVNNLYLPEEYNNTVWIDEDQTIETKIIFHKPVHVEGNVKISGTVNNIELTNLVTTDTDQMLYASYNFSGKVTAPNVTAKSVSGVDFQRWQEKGVSLVGDTQNILGQWNIQGDVIFEEPVYGNGSILGADIRNLQSKMQQFRKEQALFEKEYMKNFTTKCNKVQKLVQIAQNQNHFFKYFEAKQVITEEYKVQSVYRIQTESYDYLAVSSAQSCTVTLYKWDSYDGIFDKDDTMSVDPIAQWITVRSKDHNYIVTRSLNTNLHEDNTCQYGGLNVWRIGDTYLEHMFKLNDLHLIRESNKPGVFYGLEPGYVLQYNIEDFLQRSSRDDSFEDVRKWHVGEGHLKFVTPKIGLGLALTDGNQLFSLTTKKPNNATNKRVREANMESVVLSSVNHYLPYDLSSEIIPINVGYKHNRRRLVAVASHEKSSVKGFDFIKIYEDISEGKLFHKVPAYKPSALHSIEFETSYETLLVFLENNKNIQVYEYKGLSGFKFRSSAKMPGSQLFSMKLPLEGHTNMQHYLILIDELSITLIHAIMFGSRPTFDDLHCDIRSVKN